MGRPVVAGFDDFARRQRSCSSTLPEFDAPTGPDSLSSNPDADWLVIVSNQVRAQYVTEAKVP